MVRWVWFGIVLGALCGSGCSNNFDPYDKLITFRVLGLRAEPPEVPPGKNATLSALTFVPTATPTPVQYAWSWCPFTAGADQGYSCAITHDQLQMIVDQNLGQGTLAVPAYDLGTTATVAYGYSLPSAFYVAACAALDKLNLPKYVALPMCAANFPISIRLDATHVDDKGVSTTITSLKTLHLAYSSNDPLNTNPSIDGVSIGLKSGTTTTSISADAPPTLMRGADYRLQLAIDRTKNAEVYLDTSDPTMPPMQKTEILSVTWFSEAGGLDNTRTGFIDGEIPFENLLVNTLTTPKKADYPDARVHLVFVIRDNRDGIGWIERDVLLED